MGEGKLICNEKLGKNFIGLAVWLPFFGLYIQGPECRYDLPRTLYSTVPAYLIMINADQYLIRAKFRSKIEI